MKANQKPNRRLWKMLIAICGLLTAAFVCAVMYYQFLAEKPMAPLLYPTHYEISNSLGTSHVKAVHRVRFDKTKNKFVYYYRVENLGEEEIMFRWNVLEQAMGESLPNMFRVKAKSVYEHEFLSDSAPTIRNGGVLVYRRIGEDQWRLVPEIYDAPGPVPFGKD